MDGYDENSGESSFFDVSDSIGSGLGSIADGVVDTARSAASLVGHSNDMVGDELQTVGHALAGGWDAVIGDLDGAIYHNYAADVETNEVREDAAKLVHEDLGF